MDENFGLVKYYDIKVGDKILKDAAWYFPEPKPDYVALKGFIAFRKS